MGRCLDSTWNNVHDDFITRLLYTIYAYRVLFCGNCKSRYFLDIYTALAAL